MIGQAFADEVFRVFRREHPNVGIIPVNDNPDVKRMIARAQAARDPHLVTPHRLADERSREP